ncbi:MAG: recombinase [Peptostreptococcaceae bacterium]|nr:recombinase [Peptostreptococcaceae bacterium]
MAAHIPYGYVIEDGKAVIDEIRAKQVRQLYANYLSGDSLQNAVAKAGINTWHGTASRMLENKKYLGTKYYPAIIGRDLFDTVQEERHQRAVALGRVRDEESTEPPALDVPSATLKFWIRPLEVKFQDPYKQAEFAYSLIEREVN